MEEKYFTPIDKLAKQSLPAIATHAPQIGLFAGSIELNTKAEKYNIFATPGEATPIAYERKETMAAFVRHLYTVAANGQDREYQPTMRASEALKGCKVLIYSNADLKLPYEATQLPTPPDSGTACEIANLIGSEAELNEAQIVIIDDATQLLANDTRDKVTMLNCIADLQGFMLLYGCNVMEATDNTLDYISRHAHNLCQLTEDSIELANDEAEPQAVNYFCFTYGRPTPHRIVYSIDESGGVTIPPTPTTDLLRMEECGRLFAEKGINQATFADRVFGYYKGEFQKQTINSMISDAVKNETLQRSGAGKKHTTVCLADSPQQRKVYKGTIAIKAKLNPYIEETGYSHAFEPVALMGDFKLLAADGESKAATQWLTLELIKAVITGEKRLDFKIATSHRNTLVIVVGTDTTANSIKELIGEAKGATLDVISTNGTITDGNFLSLYRTSLNQYKSDFVFVINYDAIKQDAYTPTQLAKEIATVCKKGIVTIAQMNEWNGSEPMPTGNEFWNVKPLVDDETRSEFVAYGHKSNLPQIYEFEANADRLQFLTRFKVIHGGLTLATGNEQKEAYYRATFYWCNRTPREDICRDCTGKELTNSVIFQAERAGVIDVKKGKGYKDALITYVDK